LKDKIICFYLHVSSLYFAFVSLVVAIFMVTLTLLESQTNQPINSWNFNQTSLIRIGRASNNDIVLKGYLQVSRQHLELKLVDNEWNIASEATNGTLVNDVFVKQAKIADQDLIRLAENGPLFRFETTTKIDGESQYTSAPVADPNCIHADNPTDSIFCMHCGASLVEEERFISVYQILRVLGVGGMGTTYLVWNKDKIIKTAPFLLVLKEMNANMLRVAKARELFEREARILKSLDHPNIPRYYDFFVGEDQDHKYLIMELIHGHNLEKFTNSLGKINSERAIQWMIQVCETLTYLHGLEPPLVHRDIKPANLMLRNLDNRVMLLDFGAVKELGTSLGTRIGVEGYSAPEQYRGKPCPQSDIYGVGTSLIFLLTGKTPMQYFTYANNRYEFDVEKIPHISDRLKQVLRLACQSEPSDRYETAAELASALRECLDAMIS